MADDTPDRPDDDFQEMLRNLLGGGAAGLDPAQLEGLARLGVDPAMLQQMMAQLQHAFANGSDDGIDWSSAKTQALHLANKDGLGISSGEKQDFDQAFALATLWLSEATTTSPCCNTPPAPPMSPGASCSPTATC